MSFDGRAFKTFPGYALFLAYMICGSEGRIGTFFLLVWVLLLFFELLFEFLSLISSGVMYSLI